MKWFLAARVSVIRKWKTSRVLQRNATRFKRLYNKGFVVRVKR